MHAATHAQAKGAHACLAAGQFMSGLRGFSSVIEDGEHKEAIIAMGSNLVRACRAHAPSCEAQNCHKNCEQMHANGGSAG